MKEAYLKKKLTELSEKAQEIDQYITMQKNQLDRIESRIIEYKDLLRRLKEVSCFKEDSLKELKQQNNDHLESIINRLQQKNESMLKKQLNDKSLVLNKSNQQLERDAKLFEQYGEIVKEAAVSTVYLKEFHQLLLLKLINKGVLSHREITEIKRRAKKRSLDDD